jgi:stage III sporulation protein AH
MKIVKSTETPTERALVGFTEAVKEVPKKIGGFFTDARKKNFMIICAVFLVGAAVILNIALFGGKKTVLDAPEDAPTGSVDTENGEETSTEDPESYFALATLDRAQAREEALEVLQTIVDSTDAAEDQKQAARESISRIAEEIEMEATVETLIKAKGFSDCVAVISNGKANIIVATEETLLPGKIAQIKEILYTKAEILPVDTTIIERIVSA